MARPRRKGPREPNGRHKRDRSRDWGSPKLEVVERETAQAGQKVAVNARECLLDVLLRDGSLGQGKEAQTRHGTGIRLRKLWELAYSRRITGSFEPAIKGEESDRAWDAISRLARRALTVNTMLWTVARDACAYNQPPPHNNILRQALDELEHLV